MLKALQEARGVTEPQRQQPSLEEKLSALSNMSLSNGSKVSTAGRTFLSRQRENLHQRGRPANRKFCKSRK